MKIECSYTRLADVDSLVENPKNPNKHPEKQIQMLAKILKYQGWRHPIIVSKRSGFIVSGHGRLQAAKLNGWPQVPIDEQDFENEAAEFAHLIADNKIAELAEHDDALMIEGIREHDFEDFELLGLDDFDLPEVEVLEPQCDEDEVPEQVDTRSKPGDIWQLGRHRLMCGDSTSIDAVERLMGGEKADMVFTDPPYGMGLDTDYSKMGNTGLKHKQGMVDEFKPELIQSILAIDAKETFIFGADYFAEHLPNKNEGSWIVWDKRSSSENIGQLDGAFGSAFELCWSRQKHKREIARVLRETGYFARGDESKVYPTQKPVKLVQWFFERWGKETEVVMDLFGGSGSTLIACEKTNRKCFMMEIDPHYCDVILARWEKYTGKEAVRIDG